MLSPFPPRLRRHSRRLALIALVAMSSYPAMAEEAASAPDYAADTLTGDWSGTRTELYRRGIALDGLYRVDALRNTHGGIRRGGRPMTHLDLKLTADLDKLVDWSDTTAFINVINDRGSKVNANMTGSITGVSNIEVPVSTARVFHAWVQREFDEKRWALLAGLYPIDSEFMVMDSAALLTQPPYGALADVALTRGPSIFNNSSFGLRLRWSDAESGIYVQGAVLDGIPGNPAHPKNTHIAFRKGDGSMSIAEFGFRPTAKAGDESEGENFTKLAFGMWGYSNSVNDQVDTDANGVALRRKSRGWYALGEKTVLSTSPFGDVSVFFRYSENDGNAFSVLNSKNTGIRMKGPFAGRPDDILGIAYTRAGFGRKYIQSQAANGIAASSSETAWELTYRYQATRWLALQPLAQQFRHPGGNQAIPKATVIGLRTEVVF